MLKKLILIFAVVFALMALGAEARYSLCQNKTSADLSAASVRGLRQNSTTTYLVIDSADDKMYSYNVSNGDLTNTTHLGVLGITNARGLAINRTEERTNSFWI